MVYLEVSMIDLDVNSMYAHVIMPKYSPSKFFKSGNPYIVDGGRWFSIGVRDTEVAEWIRESDNELWYETTVQYPTHMAFDIHEKLCMMLELRFG